MLSFIINKRLSKLYFTVQGQLFCLSEYTLKWRGFYFSDKKEDVQCIYI